MATSTGHGRGGFAGGISKPGVIDSIIEFLSEATEAEPMSREEILARLRQRFQDRDPEGMRSTIKQQVPNRLNKERDDIRCHRNDRGFWVVRLNPGGSRAVMTPAKAETPDSHRRLIRETDDKARLTLPRSFANSTLLLEIRSDNEIVIRKARVVPLDEGES